MRIGYFVNQYPALSHSFIRREIIALESLGWEVNRFAIRPGLDVNIDSADKQELDKTQFIIKISKSEALLIFFKQFLFNTTFFLNTLYFAFKFNKQHSKNLLKTLICFAEACILNSWVRQKNIQHVHAHFGTNSATIVMLSKQLGGMTYSLMIHGSEEFDKPQELGLKEKIKGASFVATVSSFSKAQLSRWADFKDWQKLHVIHCALDDSFLNCPVSPVPDTPQLVCVGRLCEQKGPLLLLQAVLEIVREGLDIKLVLVGEGDMRHQIQLFIDEHQLAPYVELTGSMSSEKVREQILSSRSFILPSFAEGLPVVIMEAFALGRPVISTYIAGIPELVKNEVNGWLVPAGSLDDLVSAMRLALLASPQKLTEMGRHGRQSVLENHSIMTESKKLSQLLLDVNKSKM